MNGKQGNYDPKSKGNEQLGMPRPVKVFGYFFFGSVAVISAVSFVTTLITER
jgi:hypothetical protein